MYSEGRLNCGSLQLTQTALCTIIQLPGSSHTQRAAVNGKGCLHVLVKPNVLSVDRDSVKVA